jgi:membrane-associated phospholipid phosphatase
MQTSTVNTRLTGRGLAVWRSYAVEAAMIAGASALLIFYVDLPVALRLAQSAAGEAGLPRLDALAHLGRGEYYAAGAVLLLGLGLLLLRRPEARRRRSGWRLLRAGSLIAGTLASGHLVVFALKQTIARLRPAELATHGDYGFAMPFSGEPFTSLPSSHGFTAFAMAAVLSRLQPELRAVFFGTAMLVAVQRMLAQQHFLSDIFVSLFLALMVSSAVQAAWQAVAPRLARRLLRRPAISAAARSANTASALSSRRGISPSHPHRSPSRR